MKALAAVIVVALCGVAHADRKVALKYFRAGEKAYQAQNFEAAAQNFFEAYRVLPLPEIAFSAAQAYRRQYRVDPKPEYVKRSVELYRFYLDKVKTGGRVGDAADSLGEMERELDKLGGMNAPAMKVEERVERTQLGITVTLAGVALSTSMKEIDDDAAKDSEIAIKTLIDGKEVRPDKLHDVPPGDHIVRAEAAGFAPIERKVIANQGDPDMIDIELQPLPARVSVTTEPGARVLVDGRTIGVAPQPSIELPAGRHVLTVLQEGRRVSSRELTLARGQALSIEQPLEPTFRRTAAKWVFAAAGIAGVVTIATGTAAYLEDRDASDLNRQLEQGDQDAQLLRDYNDSRDKRDMLVTGTWLFGATAIGVGVMGGLLYYFDTPSVEGIQVTPIASGSSAGAALIGRF